jgi:hypothetical protein
MKVRSTRDRLRLETARNDPGVCPYLCPCGRNPHRHQGHVLSHTLHDAMVVS